jgi:hypothetical protein
VTGSVDKGVWEPDAQDLQLEWTLKYGRIFRYYGFFNVSVTYVSDANKLDHPMFPDGRYRYYGPPGVELYPEFSRV